MRKIACLLAVALLGNVFSASVFGATDLEQCALVPSGLISWWPGENNAADVVDGNSGVALNGATFTNGIIGRAFNFDGVNDHIRITNQPNLRMTNGLTLEAWIYPTAHGAFHEIFSKWDVAFGFNQKSYTMALLPDGRAYLTVSGNGSDSLVASVFSTNSIPLNQWTHLAATYDGAFLRMFVNGNFHAQTLYTNGIFPGTNDLAIGGFVGGGAQGQVGSPFAGRIDEPSIYNRALSAAEIQGIYTAGAAGKCIPSCTPFPGGLIAWWRGENNANDFIGNNHGALLNGSSFSNGVSGNAFRFNGNNTSVEIPYSPSLISSNYTVETWINPLSQVVDGVNQDMIFGQNIGALQLVVRPGTTGVRVALQFGVNRFTFYGVVSSNQIPIGQFTHVAGSWDGLTLRLYINGVLNAQNTPGASPVDSQCPFYIGGFYSPSAGNCQYVGQFFNGLIDEVSLYNRALSAGEIQAIFTAGSAGKCIGSPPAILTHPQDLTVNVGSPATFSVTASGTAPLSYQWRFSGNGISGATSSSFSLTNAQLQNSGAYSVVVTNAFGSVTSQVAILRVNRYPVADAGATRGFYISCNGTDASVIFDGSRSFDPDGDPLQFIWQAQGAVAPLATGMLAAATLPVGTHAIDLIVNDGLAAATNRVFISILTPALAIEHLVALVEERSPRPSPLIATLRAASHSVGRNATTAINQLLAFENQVRAQVAPNDNVLADELTHAAEQIIDVLVCMGGRVHPRPAVQYMARSADDGSVRLIAVGAPNQIYLLQASGNLVDWENIRLATAENDGTIRLLDDDAARYERRFYRIIEP